MSELYTRLRKRSTIWRLANVKTISFIVLLFFGLIFLYNNTESYFTLDLSHYDTVSMPVYSHNKREISEVKKTNIPRVKARDLMVFSYMRSGSSLTGTLLMNSSDIFYVFEPLIPLATYHYFHADKVCQMRDTVCSCENGTLRVQQALGTLLDIYSCNIRQLPDLVIQKILEEGKSGKPWLVFAECLNSTSKRNLQKEQCFDVIEHRCLQASSIVTKVLRLSFILVDKLMQILPNLNVLFLMRDPRAILNSRIQTDWFPVYDNQSKTVEDNVLSLCNKMEEDFRALEEADLKYRDRISRMKIEDVTASEAEMMKVLHFMNKPVTVENSLHIQSVFKKKAWKGGSLFRFWQKELRPEYKDFIVDKCPTATKFYL